MAQNLKNVVRLIFPESDDETFFNYENIEDYCGKIGSQSMEQILTEPATLKEDSKILTEQTQELAFTNYKTFVNTADTSRIIMKDFSKSKTSLDNYLQISDSLIYECEEFSEIAKKTIGEKSCSNAIRNQSNNLLDLLELPSLMREALNVGDYESALDLFSFIRNLSRKYNDVSAIQNTTAEVITLWFEILYNLFNQLRLDLPLSQCLQMPGKRKSDLAHSSSRAQASEFTRSQESDKDAEARKIDQAERQISLRAVKTPERSQDHWTYRKFYGCHRDSHVDGNFQQVTLFQILGYLRRANTVYESTTDESSLGVNFGYNFPMSNSGVSCGGDGLQLHFLKARRSWFEMLLEEVQSSEEDKQLRRLIELHRVHLFNVLTQHKAIFVGFQNSDSKMKEELNSNSALSSWFKEKVSSFTDLLQDGLPKEDDSSFESLFNQCMYMCLSFGRVGADMRCALTPIFKRTLTDTTSLNLEKFNYQFEAEMRSYKLPNWKSNMKPCDTENGPPDTLLEYYPLAEYCNGLVTILNSIRVTAPMNIASFIYAEFTKSLIIASQTIIQFYHREQQAFIQNEKQSFVSLCTCFTEDLTPYIHKCLGQVFPATSIAEQLGISIASLQESKILNINQSEVCGPISNILSVVRI